MERDARRTIVLAAVIAGAAALALASCKGGGGADDTGVDTATDTAGDPATDLADTPGDDPSLDTPGDEAASDDPGEVEPTHDVNGAMETVDGLEVMRVWGTREEMGYAEGALLCGRITRLIEEYALDYAVAGAGVTYEVVLAFAAGFFAIPEGDERQMRGMILGMQERCDPADMIITSDHLEAAAGGSRPVKYEDLMVAHVLPDYLCSSVTVWGDDSATGSTIHARNLDFLLDPAGVFLEEHMLKVYESSEEGGARYASVSVPGLIGCISCFSGEGVGLTMHNTAGLTGTVPTGMKPRTLAMREALVATVGEADKAAAAEAVLDASPQYMGNNLHMSLPCDGTGGCEGGYVFEFDGNGSHADGFATRRVPDGVTDGLLTAQAIVCTNHYMVRSTPPTSGGSYDRYQTLVTGVNAAIGGGGTVDAADLLAMMRTTADQNTGSPTLHTVIMDVSTMTLTVYVAESASVEAPYTTPHVIDLGAVFASF